MRIEHAYRVEVVKAPAAARHARRCGAGAEGRITVDYGPDRALAGYVSFVSPEAQFTPKQVETRSEREKVGDPRLSITERYAGRADYLEKVARVANRLAEERYVLQRDVPGMVEAAGKHWDRRMGEAGSNKLPD